MKAKEYLKNHSLIIETALSDYLRWFEEGEENYDSVHKALIDLNEVEE